MDITEAKETDRYAWNEFVAKNFQTKCHAHSIANALSKWSCRAFYTIGFKRLRVTRSLRMQLTKIFNLFQRKLKASQVQAGIEQHAAMSS